MFALEDKISENQVPLRVHIEHNRSTSYQLNDTQQSINREDFE